MTLASEAPLWGYPIRFFVFERERKGRIHKKSYVCKKALSFANLVFCYHIISLSLMLNEFHESEEHLSSDQINHLIKATSA